MTRPRVAVVPHTHWDREWYDPFQTFRVRLVETLDQVLSLLERDPGYARFTLDGQMAAVDDYLELRPNAKERIRKLVTSGRLHIGPWYVLMDEFLVSGETIVRNLQKGIARASEFGGAMKVGYLPDMFGHIAQMPQLLRLADIEHAVVWRGVPYEVDKDAFVWRSLDGSWVRAQYLATGYGNGLRIPVDPVKAKDFVEDELARMSSYLTDDLLFMNGSDHEPPQPELAEIVEAVNEEGGPELYVTSVPEALLERSTEGLPLFHGELRSGARANLLMGVASNHVDVKQAACQAEKALEQRAEPAAALFQRTAWPRQALDIAWHFMILNAAHDSACACSNDEVVHAVLERYYEARQIADSLANRALMALARAQSQAGTCVVNLASNTRSGIVKLTLPGEKAPEGTQLVSSSLSLPAEMALEKSALQSVLSLLEGDRIANDAYVTAVDIVKFNQDSGPGDGTGSQPSNDRRPEDGDPRIEMEISVHIGSQPEPGFSVDRAKQEVAAALESLSAGSQVKVRMVQAKHVTVLAKVSAVPGYGWRTLDTLSESPPALVGLSLAEHPVEVDPSNQTISNGLVQLGFDAESGTFSLNGIGGFGRIVEGGDLGDTYNYSPPRVDQIVSSPLECSFEITERGPLRARARIVSKYEWPAQANEANGIREGKEIVEVVTKLELRADSPVVLVTVSFDNSCKDHRVRFLAPLPEPAVSSEAECAFATVRRGLSAQGGPHEYPLPTFPSRRFVRAGGLTVAHQGLLEYELVEKERALRGDISPIERADSVAVTLLRSTGMLSRVGMVTRPLPAGPLLKTPGAQVQGPREFQLALCLEPMDPYEVVREAFLPLEAMPAAGSGYLEKEGSALVIDGCEVSAIKREGGLLELRLFNPWGKSTKVSIPGRKGFFVNLLGAPGERFKEGFELSPYQIATLRIEDS